MPQAANGAEAIEHIAPTVWTKRDAPQAIVSDVCMPDLTGLDLLTALR
jgi:CheY-like chemotaxis protein